MAGIKTQWRKGVHKLRNGDAERSFASQTEVLQSQSMQHVRVSSALELLAMLLVTLNSAAFNPCLSRARQIHTWHASVMQTSGVTRRLGPALFMKASKRAVSQRPWYVGLLSDMVIDGSIRDCGLTAERQNFNRTIYDSTSRRIPPYARNGVICEDHSIPCADGQQEHGARLYTPLEIEEPKTPLIVYVHGGGWCLNSCFKQPFDFNCAKLSRDLGCCVLSVDYRLAPEHPWPAAVEDVYSTLEWLACETHVAPAADRQRIVLMGESAGGNLAACVSLMCRDRSPTGIRIMHQVLISPCVPVRPLRPSRTDPARANGAFLRPWLILWMEESYAGEMGVEQLSKEPYANPLAAERLDGLPPLTGIVGSAEVLRDEGLEYFQSVKNSGVDTDWREFEGGFHAFPVFPFGQSADAWRFVYKRLRAVPGLFISEI